MDQDLEMMTPLTGELEGPSPGGAFAVALLRTHAQVPDITSEKQYELYLYLYRHLILAANLVNRDDPTFEQSLRAYVRTRDGILASVYRARIRKWRKRKEQG
jgi:hypothetical protein